jgi:2,4-dienoyl-CoA reductase-like NADH-dependent reductase (Old Yellow Enzyme family)
MSLLFTPLRLRAVELRNRITVSPMCEYSSVEGFANDWHLVHLGSRAVGGAGLVLTEAAAVSPEGRISFRDLGIWEEEHVEGLARITAFITAQGAVPGIQLAHAGRKASRNAPWEGDLHVGPESGGWKTVGPAAEAFGPGYDTPHALSDEEIHRVVADFRAAAGRAVRAGFRVVEIHAAHGYLLHQFISPLSNSRTDVWGGSFEGRTRLVRTVTAEVRKVLPDQVPLFVRLSCTDWVDGGWSINDSVALARLLKLEGADLIDCSSGGVVPGVKIPAAPGYQVPFAARIRSEAGIATGAVGIIVASGQAEEILRKGEADLIFMARELLRDPYFPLRASGELGVEGPWPPQYLRARRS